jgi:hypothetical protein
VGSVIEAVGGARVAGAVGVRGRTEAVGSAGGAAHLGPAVLAILLATLLLEGGVV